MTNPFDVNDAQFRVLTNDDGQHSLWPEFADVPPGWTCVHGPDERQACLDFVNVSWTDMRPRRVREVHAA